MKYILASKSPRRKEILSELGYNFDVLESTAKEFCNEDEPGKIVEALSLQKANNVNSRITYQEDYTIIAADTIVVFNNKVFGKPQNEDEAYQMLNQLQNNWHHVYTGVTIIQNFHNKLNITIYHEKTSVLMKALTKREIWDYIKTGEPMDKAGAYGIQGLGGKLIRQTQGEYNTIVGLPTNKLLTILKTHNQS